MIMVSVSKALTSGFAHKYTPLISTGPASVKIILVKTAAPYMKIIAFKSLYEQCMQDVESVVNVK